MCKLLIAYIGMVVLCGCSVSNQPSNPVLHPTIVATSECTYRGQLPDPVCTPGATDPIVTQNNLGATICKAGYTATVRPSVSFTGTLKLKQMKQYGVGDRSPKEFEEDHLISLELGGAPADPKNLWPEPGASPNQKDRIENQLHTLVCNGRMSLIDAQHRIAIDWTKALP